MVIKTIPRICLSTQVQGYVPKEDVTYYFGGGQESYIPEIQSGFMKLEILDKNLLNSNGSDVLSNQVNNNHLDLMNLTKNRSHLLIRQWWIPKFNYI